VRWTPTLVFFDEKGAIALQVSGYQSPEEFNRVLDRAAGRSLD
jgi:thioredoxin-related protein